MVSSDPLNAAGAKYANQFQLSCEQWEYFPRFDELT